MKTHGSGIPAGSIVICEFVRKPPMMMYTTGPSISAITMSATK